MRIRVSDPRLTDDLIRFFLRRDCLAVKRADGLIEALPINPVSERYDRTKIRTYVREWEATRPDAKAQVID